jgi:hypothetical protein
LGVFKKAAYLSSTEIPDEDDSSTLASTEWVNKRIKNSTSDVDLYFNYDEGDVWSWVNYTTGLTTLVKE